VLDRVASTCASPSTKALDSTRRLAREVVGAACRARRRKTAAPQLLRALSGAVNPGLGARVRTVQDACTLVPAETHLTARRPASKVTRPRRRCPTPSNGGAARPRARARRRAGVTSSVGVRTVTVRVRGSPTQQLHSTTTRSQIREGRRRNATRRPSSRRVLGLGSLGCARARTHALNHKTKLTAARGPETQNSRLGATLASQSSGASRGVPWFDEQKSGQAPTYLEHPALRLGVATMRGFHQCGAARLPFTEDRRRTAHSGSMARNGSSAREGRVVVHLTLGRRCSHRRIVKEGGTV
jgi:hypothetical protein